jgi:UDP-N-acetyl-D-glucosamine dehydrogenase
MTHPAVEASSTEAALVARLAAGTARIGVVGLGYAGFPLARRFARLGFAVAGFDSDAAKLAALRDGRSPLPGGGDSGGVRAAALTEAGDCDAICIAVPTPLAPDRSPDLGAIHATLASLSRHLRPGQAISLESTTYPGCTRQTVGAALAAAGLTLGETGFAIHSPEREDPGVAGHSVADTPKLVAGATSACLRVGLALYRGVAPCLVPMSSLEAAELTKLHENTFRAVNIALANEMKLMAQAMGLDPHEVVDAAATKPFGFMPFHPGPGLGGHCVPVDPWYLAWAARRAGVAPRFIELAAEVNDAMPRRIVDRLALALNGLAGRRILVLGVAYKPDVPDTRESPALEIIALIEAAGGTADFHDPCVPVLPATRRLGPGGRTSVSADARGHDAAVLVTPHRAMNLDLVLRTAALVVDTRGALRGHPNVIQA